VRGKGKEGINRVAQYRDTPRSSVVMRASTSRITVNKSIVSGAGTEIVIRARMGITLEKVARWVGNGETPIRRK